MSTTYEFQSMRDIAAAFDGLASRRSASATCSDRILAAQWRGEATGYRAAASLLRESALAESTSRAVPPWVATAEPPRWCPIPAGRLALSNGG